MQQVADRVPMAKSLYGDWELGSVASPDPTRLVKLAALLDIDARRLLKAAGHKLDGALPSMQPYLRTKYKHLPKEARAEIADAFECISAKYGTTRLGPEPGQDE